MKEKKSYLEYWLPPLLFLLMLIDGQITSLLKMSSQGGWFFNSHLLLLFLMMASFRCSKKMLLISSAVIGLLLDSYYYSVIGIYLLVLPLTVWLIYTIFKHVPSTPVPLFLAFVVIITFTESMALALQGIFQLVVPNPIFFITQVLSSTLLLNITYLVVLIIPLRKFFLTK